MGPKPTWLVSLPEEKMRTQTLRDGQPCEDTGRRQRLRTQETGLRRNHPADALISNVQPPDCESINFCCLGCLFRGKLIRPLTRGPQAGALCPDFPLL